jgi:hypothetical protein
MAVSATDLLTYAAQTFEERIVPKLKEWGLEVLPLSRGDCETGWLLESKAGYLTRIFIVLYEPYGIGIYESVVDKTKIYLSKGWKKRIWRRLREVVSDAITRLSGKEVERDYDLPFNLFAGGVITHKLLKPAGEEHCPEIYAYIRMTPKELAWRWTIVVHRNRKEVICVREEESNIKEPIEAYRQLIKIVLASVLL